MQMEVIINLSIGQYPPIGMSYKKYPEHRDTKKKRDRSSSSSSSSQSDKNKIHKHSSKFNKYSKDQKPYYPHQSKNYHKTTHQQLKINWKPPEKSKRQTIKEKKNHKQKANYSSSSKSSNSSSSSSRSRRKRSSHSSRSQKLNKRKKYDDFEVKHKQSHGKHREMSGNLHFKQRRDEKISYVKPIFKEKLQHNSSFKFEKKESDKNFEKKESDKNFRQNKQHQPKSTKIYKQPQNFRINHYKTYNNSFEGPKHYENPPDQPYASHRKNHYDQHYHHQQLKKYPSQHESHHSNPPSFHNIKSPSQNTPFHRHIGTNQSMNPLLRKSSLKNFQEQNIYKTKNFVKSQKTIPQNKTQNKVQVPQSIEVKYTQKFNAQVQVNKRKLPTPDQYPTMKNIPNTKEIQKKTISRFVQTMQQAKKNLLFQPPKSNFLILDSFRSMSRFDSQTIDPEWLNHLNQDLQGYDNMKKQIFSDLSINEKKANIHMFIKRNITEEQINLKRSIEETKQNCTSLNQLSRMITMIQVDLQIQ